MATFLASLFKRKKATSILLLILILLSVAVPQTTQAINWGCIGGIIGCVVYSQTSGSVQDTIAEAVKHIANAIVLLLATIPLFISGAFSFIANTLLNWIMALSIQGVSYTSLDPSLNPAVAAGWPVMRDFANIIIVLGFIATAMATILRYQEYEAKRLLGKLIIAAILVNFSLVICGIIIDISNSIMAMFLGLANSGTLGTSTSEFSNSLTILQRGLGTEADATWVFLAKSLGQIFFNMAKGIVAMLYAFLFIFRVFALWIMVVLSPLAFACAAFPGRLGSIWDRWLSNFLQWCFVGIGGAIFLWLGTAVQAEILRNPVTGILAPIGDLSTRTYLQHFTGLITYAIPGTFLIMGFLFALQTSAMGSGYAIAGFNKVRGYATSGAKWAGKFAADNTGVTRAKNAVVDRATELGERVGVVGRGTAAANRKARQTSELGDKDREKRVDNLSATEMVTELRRQPTLGGTRENALDRAAMLKKLAADGKIDMLQPAEQMQLLQDYQQYGVKPHEIVAKMDTVNQNAVISGNMFNAKTREEALKALAAKGQLDPSIAGSLNQAQIINAMQEARTNGSDLKEVINGLQGAELADIITSHQNSLQAGGLQILDGPTRAKVLKALADKKQLDLMTQAEQIDAMNEAAINGVKPQDLVVKMSSENQAHIIENNLFTPETQSKAVESLSKKKELHIISEVHRDRAYAQAIANGVDAEELGEKDYRAGAHNPARLQRLGAPLGITAGTIEQALEGNRIAASGGTPTPAQTTAMATVTPLQDAARNEVLDENISGMNGDQLRDINFGDLTYERVSRFTPDKVRQFQRAPQTTRDQFRLYINPAGLGAGTGFELDDAILEEQNEADNANRGFPPGTATGAKPATGNGPLQPDNSQAGIHRTEANRLMNIRRAIANLP